MSRLGRIHIRYNRCHSKSRVKKGKKRKLKEKPSQGKWQNALGLVNEAFNLGITGLPSVDVQKTIASAKPFRPDVSAEIRQARKDRKPVSKATTGAEREIKRRKALENLFKKIFTKTCLGFLDIEVPWGKDKRRYPEPCERRRDQDTARTERSCTSRRACKGHVARQDRCRPARRSVYSKMG